MSIDVQKKWATTPCVCLICNHKVQLVFETDIISDEGKESWKLPHDIECPNCKSVGRMEFTDFTNNTE